MLIDTHCHVDQFPCPEAVVQECENGAIRVVAVTNLPSHFALAADRLRGHRFVSAALGMHPLFVNDGIRELAAFKRMAPYANFIGEVGLDFSRHGELTRALQETVFEEVLLALASRPRFITLHSRGAEIHVLEALGRHKIQSAVFHWFTGSSKELDRVLQEGHLLSVNAAMVGTVSGKRVLTRAARSSVLVESDSPLAKINGRVSHPNDIVEVYKVLANQWNCNFDEAVETVSNNFNRVLQPLNLGKGENE